MCRCCQDCCENFIWNCFEEKFCYDESIANYNPEDVIGKNGSIFDGIQLDNNNLGLSVVSAQPLYRNLSMNSNTKIHEEDYRRETQTNVPMLGPEILAVFANSQIFQDHQPTKLNRISTKTLLAGVHSPHYSELQTTPRENDKDHLINRLKGYKTSDATDSTQRSPIPKSTNNGYLSPDKHITFTLTTDSSPEGSQIHSITEEADGKGSDEVLLRPQLIDRHPLLKAHDSSNKKKQLRSVKSVPYFSVHAVTSETDIFAITGSGQISMTPEVPSISYSNLPKNYEDTPTIENYRVSHSLYSIQTANATKAGKDDYSMPRYFRRSAMLTQSTEILSTSIIPCTSSSKFKDELRRPEKERSKRLQMFRGALPPLLIHSVSFRKSRDEAKQMD